MKEIERPFMRDGNRLSVGIDLAPRQFDKIPGIQCEERQRNNLHSREYGREGKIDICLAGPIPVMPGADNPGAQKEDGVQVDDSCRGETGNHTQPVKDDGHHYCDKEFKKAFDPEVDDPEAPVVDDGIPRSAAEKESRQIEKRNRQG